VQIIDEFEEETFTKDPDSWPPGKRWTYHGYDDYGRYFWRRPRS
jgi:hypothetical protein